MGQAALLSSEGQLEVEIRGDQLGRMTVVGAAMDVVGTGNRLEFRLTIDQSYIPVLRHMAGKSERPERMADAHASVVFKANVLFCRTGFRYRS